MAKIMPTREELVGQLRKQFGFLQRSAALFDQGVDDEAARMAVPVRVLLHDTANSHSLLGQLGLKDKMRFASTVLADPPTAPDTLYVDMVNSGLVRLEGHPPRYTAPLGSRPVTAWQSFDDWWNTPVAKVNDGSLMSRWQLIDVFAHQDRGAHVDPKGIEERYLVLATMGTGFAYIENVTELPSTLDVSALQYPSGNAAAASMRQIAHELVCTVDASPEIAALR